MIPAKGNPCYSPTTCTICGHECNQPRSDGWHNCPCGRTTDRPDTPPGQYEQTDPETLARWELSSTPPASAPSDHVDIRCDKCGKPHFEGDCTADPDYEDRHVTATTAAITTKGGTKLDSTGGVSGVFDLGALQRTVDQECHAAFVLGQIEPQRYANHRQSYLWRIEALLKTLGASPLAPATPTATAGATADPAGRTCVNCGLHPAEVAVTLCEVCWPAEERMPTPDELAERRRVVEEWLATRFPPDPPDGLREAVDKLTVEPPHDLMQHDPSWRDGYSYGARVFRRDVLAALPAAPPDATERDAYPPVGERVLVEYPIGSGMKRDFATWDGKLWNSDYYWPRSRQPHEVLRWRRVPDEGWVNAPAKPEGGDPGDGP